MEAQNSIIKLSLTPKIDSKEPWTEIWAKKSIKTSLELKIWD